MSPPRPTKPPNRCNLPAVIMTKAKSSGAHDGSRIYFLTRRIDEPYYETPSTDIYSVGSTGGTPEKLATVPMGIGDLTLSPDGHRIAFHGSVTQPIRSYSQPDLWVMDLLPMPSPATLPRATTLTWALRFRRQRGPARRQRPHALLVARRALALRHRGEARTHAASSRGCANRRGYRNYSRRSGGARFLHHARCAHCGCAGLYARDDWRPIYGESGRQPDRRANPHHRR